MPVDLPPRPSGVEIAPVNGLFSRLLNWTAVLVAIGLCWWAAVLLF
jgi:hypothetical protein